MTAPNHPLAGTLWTFRLCAASLLPALPPADLIAVHDTTLAELIREARTAEAAVVPAAMAWSASLPGGAGFAAHLAADDQIVAEHLDRTGGLPGLDVGDLYGALVYGAAAAYVHAHRADTLARFRHRQVVRYVVGADELRQRLDVESDRVRDQIRAHLEQARDRKDSDAMVDARRLQPRWAELSALYVWMTDPTKPYRQRASTTLPEELAYANWEATGATTGTYPTDVPLPADTRRRLDAEMQRR